MRILLSDIWESLNWSGEAGGGGGWLRNLRFDTPLYDIRPSNCTLFKLERTTIKVTINHLM